MPIDNRLFGVWKTFAYGGRFYVVESADESVSQDISPKNYIMGTAMPRVMEIKGAEAALNINAPLLVASDPYSSGTPTPRTGAFGDSVHDGLTLVKNLGATTYMDGGYSHDPFFIYKSINFSVSADAGATYKISAVGDYDALHSENTASTAGFGLYGPTTTVVPGGTVGTPLGAAYYPTTLGYAYRVASFYDFDVSIGGITFGSGTYLQELTVDVQYTIQDFSWVGQPDQRKYYGIAGMSATVSGTIISQERWPTGHGMPLQAEKSGITLPAPYTGATLHTGGLAWPTTGTFAVYLRNSTGGTGPAGVVDVLPQTSSSGQRFVFSTSSLQASTGLLTTRFEGQMWAQTNS